MPTFLDLFRPTAQIPDQNDSQVVSKAEQIIEEFASESLEHAELVVQMIEDKDLSIADAVSISGIALSAHALTTEQNFAKTELEYDPAEYELDEAERGEPDPEAEDYHVQACTNEDERQPGYPDSNFGRKK